MLQFEAPKENSNYIKVVGVGGGGTNAVNHMYSNGIQGVDFIVCNTDGKSLYASPVLNKIKLGKDELGAGNRPEVGRASALMREGDIREVLESNTQMLFITAGMGGGTGTGAAPIVAKIAKDIKLKDNEGQETDDKILVVAVVTLPFTFEGKKRKEQAEEGIRNLREIVDALIIVNTDKIRNRGNFPMSQAFAMADDILLTATKGIAEIITLNNSYISVDFRDVQSVMEKSGVALMGVGTAYGSGEERAIEAIKMATTSDLLNDCDIRGTKNILLYITTSKGENEFTLDEQEAVAEYIKECTEGEPDIIWGIGYDESYGDRLDITLVATGFEQQEIYNTVYRTIEEKKPLEQPVKTMVLETPKMDIKEEDKIINNSTVNTIPITSESIIPQPVLVEPEPIRAEMSQLHEIVEHEQQPSKTVHILDVEIPTSHPSTFVFPKKEETPVINTVSEFKAQADIVKSQSIEVVETVKKPELMARLEEDVDLKRISQESRVSHNPFFDKDKTPEMQLIERQKRMEMIAKKMREKNGVDELYNTPAYALKGIEVESETHSSASDSSRINLNDGRISFNNSYLHDQPD